MCALLAIAAMTMGYLGAQELLRRCRLPALWAVFFLMPVVLTPYWIKSNDFDPFVWLKVYSILFCVSWGGWLRFTSAGDSAAWRHTIIWLLAANIVEAMVVDCLGAGLAHRLNVLAGILLLATMPRSRQSVTVDRTSRDQDIRYRAPLSWIVGYTLWNWAFVCLNYPAFLGHHTAILAAALIVACVNPQLWLQTRASTLGLNLLLMATSCAGTLAVSDTTDWQSERLSTGAASVAFTWLAVHALLAARSRVRRLSVAKSIRQGLCCFWPLPCQTRARLSGCGA